LPAAVRPGAAPQAKQPERCPRRFGRERDGASHGSHAAELLAIAGIISNDDPICLGARIEEPRRPAIIDLRVYE
jgi:hypothetical protein